MLVRMVSAAAFLAVGCNSSHEVPPDASAADALVVRDAVITPDVGFDALVDAAEHDAAEPDAISPHCPVVEADEPLSPWSNLDPSALTCEDAGTELADTQWTLAAFRSSLGGISEVVLPTTTLRVRMDGPNLRFVFELIGCNTYTRDAVLSGDCVTWLGFSITAVGCPSCSREMDAMQAAIDRASFVRVDAEGLVLYDGAGRWQVAYRPGATP